MKNYCYRRYIVNYGENYVLVWFNVTFTTTLNYMLQIVEIINKNRQKNATKIGTLRRLAAIITSLDLPTRCYVY